MSSKKIYTYLIIKKKVVTPIDPLNQQYTAYICPVVGLKRMTTGSAVSALSYRTTQVDKQVV